MSFNKYQPKAKSKRLPRSGGESSRAADAKSLGALAAQAAYTAPLTLPASIRARPGRLG